MRFMRILVAGAGLWASACGLVPKSSSDGGGTFDAGTAAPWWADAGDWGCADQVQSSGECICNSPNTGGSPMMPCSSASEYCCWIGRTSSGVAHCECAVQGRVGNQGCDSLVQSHVGLFSDVTKVAACPPM